MPNQTYTSIFRRLQSSYEEDSRLCEWIRADASNPLNQMCQIINFGEVLDIGCGTGILGRLLEGNPRVVVDGIDPAVSTDTPGIQGYRRFFSQGIEQLLDGDGIGRYDWIVMADVIEHLAYPDEVLAALVSRAKPGARFLLSTPNVAHLSIRFELLRGRFDYSRSGILESTHLRFFTMSTLQSVLSASGLNVECILLLNRIPTSDEISSFGWLRALFLLALVRGDESLYTYQFLAVAQVGGESLSAQTHHVGPRGLLGRYLEIIRTQISKLSNRVRYFP